MDLFGDALQSWAKRDYAPYYLHEVSGARFAYPLEHYFRTRFSAIETKAIEAARGRILDVGCATGYLLHALERQGDVLGIDISAGALSLAPTNTRRADIFEFETAEQFDTITLFENNIGMAGTIERTRELLAKLRSLLAPGGQILSVSNKVSREHGATFVPEFKGTQGEPFSWLFLSQETILTLFEEAGFKAEVLAEDAGEHALRARMS